MYCRDKLASTRDSVKISQLVMSLGKALNRIAFACEWLNWYCNSNRWQLDAKIERVPSLSPG